MTSDRLRRVWRCAAALLVGSLLACGRASADGAHATSKCQDDQQSREIREALRQARDAYREAMNEARRAQALGVESGMRALAGAGADRADALALLSGLDALRNLRINIDLDNVPIREAFRRVFGMANQRYVLADDLPKGLCVSLRAEHVGLTTAVGLFSEAARVNWSITSRFAGDSDRRTVYTVFTVGKPSTGAEIAPAVWPMNPVNGLPDAASLPPSVTGLDAALVAATQAPRVYNIHVREQRATFVCPYCRGEVVTLHCQQDAHWKFCPLCGHRVDVEDSGDGR